MATGDLYFVRGNLSTNDRAWSIGFWLEEVDPISIGGDGLTVAKAVNGNLTTTMQSILSDTSTIDSWNAARRWTGPNAAGQVYPSFAPGLRTGSPLSNDNALFINLQQTVGPAKHNGGFFVAGQSADDSANSEFDATYLSTQVKSFTDALTSNFDAVSPESGRWRLVVISKTIQPQTTFVGTPLDVTRAVAASRVLTQSRRRQKVEGFK